MVESAVQWRDAVFLIVDDQEFNLSLLQRILNRNEFSNLILTMNPLEVIDLYQSKKPDIILLDLHMPEKDGFEVMEDLKQYISPKEYVPILVLTADITPEAKKMALSVGAKDFLTKPFDRTEVMLRINNLLETRYLYKQIQEHNQYLEHRVQMRTRELENAQLEVLNLLGKISEFRDDVTGQHTLRVGELSAKLAGEIGLSEDMVEIIRKAAPLHDLGKVGIPDGILLKPGKFTEEEFNQMKHHTIIGASIVSGSLFPIMQAAEAIALCHHEKWDGTGYPKGLKGNEIPIESRIVAITDFYDALTHERPYKLPWSHEEALAEIDRQKGIHFDPDIAETFIRMIEKGVTYYDQNIVG